MTSSWRAAYAVVALIAIATLLPLSPAYPSEPNRDGGLFLYAGAQILHGAIPYRDLWDHKPPLIFYINALGLALPLPSWWGVWLVESAMIATAASLTMRLFARFGPLAASIACMTWLSVLFICSIGGRGGNVTEPPALLFQFLALYLWSRRASSFAIGMCAAGAFLLKPPLIGVWLAIAVVMLIDDSRAALREAVPAASGALVTIGLFAIYFAFNGALGDAYDQIIHYNSEYTKFATSDSRSSAAAFGLDLLARFGALPALLYWAYVAIVRVRRWRSLDPLLQIAIVGLPIEIFLAALPGRTYEHYFVAALPSVAILTACLIADAQSAPPPPLRRAAVLGIVCISLLVLNNSLRAIRAFVFMRSPAYFRYASMRDRAAAVVRDSVPREQPVLIWGAEAAINFLSDHPSPTRYAYLHPLMTTGYADAMREREFLIALQRNPPALIIDTSTTESLFPALDPAQRRQWVPWPAYVPPAEFDRVIAWINAHYERSPLTPVPPWSFYRRVAARTTTSTRAAR